jgi:Tfp pilus assembly protein PilO
MKNNNKIYTILLIFILISLFLVIFGVWPLLENIENNSKDLVSAKNNIAILNNQIDEIENFKNNYAIYKPNLEKIDGMFVDLKDPVDFIEFIENTAYECSIDLQIHLPVSNQGASAYIIFQLSSEGNFSDILDFTKKIESGPYLVEIEKLTIQNLQNKDEGKNGYTDDYVLKNVVAEFSLKAFTKNEISL